MIEFQSVSKKYRDGTAAVVDLDLTIPSDKITVIVGPSGCGKTTTLRMINRMLEPTSGKIMWDDKPLRSKRRTSLRRQMGYVIQSGGLFPHRTVLENISTVPGLLGWDRTKTKKRAMELLSDVGLERKLASRYPGQLSGGQQQRVGVARALCADPMVMLMDEPFSAVDPVVRAELHELFLGLQQELSKTIVLITHDIDEAIKLGDQVAILRVGGKLAQVGTPQQLLDEPADDFVESFVGKDRGYRAMSFLAADGLQLNRVKAVRDASSVEGREPTLVIDAEARPIGWADVDRPGQVLGLGAIFDPGQDTMRAALDSALTSPVGLAVAVDGASGRYAGTVTATEILTQVKESRASIAQSVSVREEEARAAADDPGTTDEGPEDGEPAAEKIAEGDQDTAVGVAAAAGAAGAGEAESGTETGTDEQQDSDVTLVGGVPVETAEPVDQETDQKTDRVPAEQGSADVTAPDAEPAETAELNTEPPSADPVQGDGPVQGDPVQGDPVHQDPVPDQNVAERPDHDATHVQPAVQEDQPAVPENRAPRDTGSPDQGDQGAGQTPDPDATTVHPALDDQGAVQEPGTTQPTNSPNDHAPNDHAPDETWDR